MNTAHLNFSKEHNIIKEAIITGGKIALKWFNNKPNVWKKENNIPDLDLPSLMKKVYKHVFSNTNN